MILMRLHLHRICVLSPNLRIKNPRARNVKEEEEEKETVLVVVVRTGRGFRRYL
jgi:hypothetical protein